VHYHLIPDEATDYNRKSDCQKRVANDFVEAHSATSFGSFEFAGVAGNKNQRANGLPSTIATRSTGTCLIGKPRAALIAFAFVE
jgi:hypothetical protein